MAVSTISAGGASLSDLLKNMHQHEISHFHSNEQTQETQKDVCITLLKTVKREISSTVEKIGPDTPPLFFDLLKTAVTGSFCPEAVAIFVSGENRSPEFAKRIVASLILAICDSTTTINCIDQLVESLERLAKLIARVDVTSFMAIANDLHGLLKTLLETVSVPMIAALPSIANQSSPGATHLHLDVSTDQKRYALFTGVANSLRAFAAVPLSRDLKSMWQCTELLCQALERTGHKNTVHEMHLQAWIKSLSVLCSQPDAQLRVARALMEHASKGDVQIWSESYSSMLVNVTSSVMLRSQQQLSIDHILAYHCSGTALVLLTKLSQCSRNELAVMNVFAIDILTRLVSARPAILVECAFEIFSPDSALVRDVKCSASIGRFFASVLRLGSGIYLRRAMSMISGKSLIHQRESSSDLETRKKIRTTYIASEEGNIDMWFFHIIDAMPNLDSALAIGLEIFWEPLQDASRKTERDWILQTAASRLVKFDYQQSDISSLLVILEIVFTRFYGSGDALRAHPIFERRLLDLVSLTPKVTKPVLELLSKTQIKLSENLVSKCAESLVQFETIVEPAVMGVILQSDDASRSFFENKMRTLNALFEESTSSLSSWQNISLKEKQHRRDITIQSLHGIVKRSNLTNCFAQMIPRLAGLLNTGTVDSKTRVSLVQLIAEIVRKATAPLIHASALEYSKCILGMLSDRDPAVSHQAAIDVSCFIENTSIGWDMLALIFNQPSKESGFASFMSFMDGLILDPVQDKFTRRSLLEAVGSVGSAARIQSREYSGVHIGLVQWSLHVLAGQWVMPDNSISDVMIKVSALEQYRKIACAQNFVWRGCRRASNAAATIQHSGDNAGEAIRKLFDSVSLDLYPQLFCTLLRNGDDHEMRRSLNDFLQDVFEDSAPDRITTFLGNAFPIILPSYIKTLTNPEVAQTLERISRLMSETNMKNLLNRNFKNWIIAIIELKATSESEDGIVAPPSSLSSSQSNIMKGKEAAASILATVHTVFDESELHQMLKAGNKTILERLTLELVHRGTGQPNGATESYLHVLGRTLSHKPPISSLIRKEFMFLMNLLSERIIQERWDDRSWVEKRHALNCVSRLLELIGKEYTADEFLPKIMPTLSSALHEKELQISACRALKTLARKLSDEAFAKNVSGFIVALLPCLIPKDGGGGAGESRLALAPSATTTRPHLSSSSSASSSQASPENFAVELIQVFVTERRELEKRVLSEIQELLPDHPALRQVSALLVSTLGERTLTERLDQLSGLVDRDSDEIKLLALKELRLILEKRSGEIAAIILNRQQPHHISKLIMALFRTARAVGARLDETISKTSYEICLKCCECLGEIGAVDPALLNLSAKDDLANMRKDLALDHDLDMGNEQLAKSLLCFFLVDALENAPDPDTHMRVGYAVQELLLFLSSLLSQEEISAAAARGMSKEELLLSKFSAEEANVLRPLTRTNYSLTKDDPVVKSGRGGKTFFGPEVPFAASVGEWVASLIKLTQGAQNKIFTPLVVLKNSDCATRMILFVLPYVLQNVLSRGKDVEADSVKEEIICILEDAFSGREADEEDHPPHHRSDDTGGEQQQRYHNVNNTISAGGRVQLSIQAVFVILDTLSRWVMRSSIASSARRNPLMKSSLSAKVYSGEFDDKSRLQRFLKSIPKLYLAEAALKCNSSTRSLFYLESHIRSLHSRDDTGGGGGIGGPGSWRGDEETQFDRDEVELLHKICATVEQDPDSLRGVVVLRTRHNGGPGTGHEMGRILSSSSSPVTTSTTTSRPLRDLAVTNAAAQGQPRLLEQIHELESESRWDEALSCYEEAIEIASSTATKHNHERGGEAFTSGHISADESNLHEGQLRCLSRAGHLEILVSVADGKLSRAPWLRPVVIPYAVDALWRLGKWPELKMVLESTSTTPADAAQGSSSLPPVDSLERLSFVRKGAPGGISGEYSESLAAALLAAIENRDFDHHVKFARVIVLQLLSAASMESYEKAYPLLVKLQGLVELERGLSAGAPLPDEKWWSDRLKLTSPSPSLRAELLAMRRCIYRISSSSCIDSGIGPTTTNSAVKLEAESWLSLAKTAREFGDVSTCESALLMLRKSLATGSKEEQVMAWASSWRARVQKAELLKLRGSLFDALLVLQPESELLSKVVAGEDCPPILARARAKALLLATNIVVETGSIQGSAIVDRYQKVLEWRPQWERGTYYLAKYCDYLLQRIQESANTATVKVSASTSEAFQQQQRTLLVRALKTYGDTLKLGTKHLFEVLPRILTLWYSDSDRTVESGGGAEAMKTTASSTTTDQSASRAVSSSGAAGAAQVSRSASLLSTKGSAVKPTPSLGSTKKVPASSAKNSAASSTSPGEASTSSLTPNDILMDLKSSLAPTIWYTALAQLVSRLCHPELTVWAITKDIVANILAHLPSRAFWQVMGIVYSKVQARKNRVEELLFQFQQSGVASSVKSKHHKQYATKYLEAAMGLFTGLINLAKDKTDGKYKHFDRALKFDNTDHYGLVLPMQTYLQIPVMATSQLQRSSSDSAPLFLSVGSKVEVMQSKEKPKKIQVTGTDGVTRNFLCKYEQKGDLRKDSRLMEFSSVLNELFTRDVQARRRGLRLRTYTVICLNEDCGLLEWVENTQGFRAELAELYHRDGISANLGTGRGLLSRIQTETHFSSEMKAERVERYRDEVLRHFPPRFHKWFLQRFPEPSSWLDARTKFTRSAATWSMVGHVVGLGDRHAENLLLDVTSGECVHVDFDCLFDKGLDLTVPEIVPFRLTRNMVDGMGLTGVEGTFRSACEVSMGVLRGNKTMLLSVLESFVVDPLVEWNSKRPDPAAPESSTMMNKPVDAHHITHQTEQQRKTSKDKLNAIAERLSGIVRDREVLAAAQRKAKNLPDEPKPATRGSLRRIPSAGDGDEAGSTISSLGSIGLFEALPVSTQGQVDRLIRDATDEDKLSRMFIGWCPFL